MYLLHSKRYEYSHTRESVRANENNSKKHSEDYPVVGQLLFVHWKSSQMAFRGKKYDAAFLIYNMPQAAVIRVTSAKFLNSFVLSGKSSLIVNFFLLIWDGYIKLGPHFNLN